MRANPMAIVVVGAAVAVSALPDAGVAGPPPIRRELPGRSLGSTETRWLAPYVLLRRHLVGKAGVTSVRWFDDNGKVTRELAGPGVDACAGFLSDYGAAGPTYYGIQSHWKLVLPKKGAEAGYIAAAGETFIHQFHPQRGQIAVDISARRNGWEAP